MCILLLEIKPMTLLLVLDVYIIYRNVMKTKVLNSIRYIVLTLLIIFSHIKKEAFASFSINHNHSVI